MHVFVSHVSETKVYIILYDYRQGVLAVDLFKTILYALFESSFGSGNKSKQ